MQWFTSVTGSKSNAEFPLHEPRRRVLERLDAVVGVAAILRPIDLLGHHAADRRIGHVVVLADAEIDQFSLGMLGQRFPLGPLDLLELVNLGAFSVVGAADALGEELLKVGVAHGRLQGRKRASDRTAEVNTIAGGQRPAEV